jgi:hypothetical protein
MTEMRQVTAGMGVFDRSMQPAVLRDIAAQQARSRP